MTGYHLTLAAALFIAFTGCFVLFLRLMLYPLFRMFILSCFLLTMCAVSIWTLADTLQVGGF